MERTNKLLDAIQAEVTRLHSRINALTRPNYSPTKREIREIEVQEIVLSSLVNIMQKVSG